MGRFRFWAHIARLRHGLAGLWIVAALFGAPAFAADPVYPSLTGRVVDGANVVPPDAKAALTQKLRDLEAKSGIQLVVATVASLNDQEIEPYANGLFRAWQLGDKTKNNGVLFLIAPKERKIRIEVGYGLEGTLTDALSKIIITNAVAPKLKTGDFAGGVTRGVDDIITVLTTDSADWKKNPALQADLTRLPAAEAQSINSNLVLGLLAAFILLMIFSSTCRSIVYQILLFSIFSGSSGRQGGSGSSDSFSGGGGSSGGGGASGDY